MSTKHEARLMKRMLAAADWDKPGGDEHAENKKERVPIP